MHLDRLNQEKKSRLLMAKHFKSSLCKDFITIYWLSHRKTTVFDIVDRKLPFLSIWEMYVSQSCLEESFIHLFHLRHHVSTHPIGVLPMWWGQAPRWPLTSLPLWSYRIEAVNQFHPHDHRLSHVWEIMQQTGLLRSTSGRFHTAK